MAALTLLFQQFFMPVWASFSTPKANCKKVQAPSLSSLSHEIRRVERGQFRGFGLVKTELTEAGAPTGIHVEA